MSAASSRQRQNQSKRDEVRSIEELHEDPHTSVHDASPRSLTFCWPAKLTGFLGYSA